MFDDDPNLKKEHLIKLKNRGGSGLISLKKENGLLVGKRDITLGLNIQNYK